MWHLFSLKCSLISCPCDCCFGLNSAQVTERYSIWSELALILLQIVMVSPAWDSSCKKIMSPTPERLSLSLKKKWVPGSFVTTQLIWSYTPNFVLQFTEIKIYSFYCKVQRRLKEISVVYQQPQKSHKHILQKHLQIRQSIFACYGTHTTNCFACLGNFFASGRRGNKIIWLAIKFYVISISIALSRAFK